jgi:isoleucyl-tRNA synthetase
MAAAPPSPVPVSSAPAAGSVAPTSLLLGVEKQVLEFWDREQVPRRALELHPDGPIFRFTEGPPTANGRPHIGHLLPRALKDVGLRHRRMKGHRIISMMAGWDCHGLPVEVEIEKSHGWTNKKQILEYGVEAFAKECRASVLTYVDVWQQFSRRLGFWLDYAHPYFTMEASFMESVWWSLKELHKKDLLEKGHYVVPYCPRCETPEATHEVAQGYREVGDPSITLRLKVAAWKDGETASAHTYLLVWTTTPWTLPSNLAVAVGTELEYVVFRGEDGAEYVIESSSFLRYFAKEAERPVVLRRVKGRELVGTSYVPPFPGLEPESASRFRVHEANFVTTEDGTGLVHIAPSFGVDDYALGAKVGLGVSDPLDSSGRFTEKVPLVAGKWFKDADKLLIEDLHARGVLWRRGTVKHTYPFCWRCDRPLMYRAIDTWFVRTHKFKDRLLANNAKVTWDPEHLRDGRFGDFLAEGKDWALSRNRYWGTPLPIWNCPKGHYVVVGSFAELAELSAEPLPQPFDPHRHVVDGLRLSCPEHREPLAREPYVIDCWYDAGSAPFAQFHYPFAETSPFDPRAPLDYIAEAIDQTRGWFYTLLVISTALFDRPAYKHVLCDGHALDDAGKKMSKSKGNTTDPSSFLDRMGSDPTRMTIYLSPYTESFRFGEVAIRQSGVRLLTTLLNVLEFYRTNLEVDRVPPAHHVPAVQDPLDRWLLSRLHATQLEVDQALEGFDPRTAAQSVDRFVQDLSTWWLRRSRPRFWAEGSSVEKRSAYDTLSYSLLTLAGLLAPLAPFTAEHLFQTVGGHGYRSGEESVHLRRFPAAEAPRDPALEKAMADLREVVESVRRLRMEAGVKSRMPLEELFVAGLSTPDVAPLGEAYEELLSEELNVKQVRLLTKEEFGAREWPATAWVVHRDPAKGAVELSLSRTPSRMLFLEGLAREAVRRVQMSRKLSGLVPTDRIRLELWAEGDLAEALKTHERWIAQECLAPELRLAGGSPDPAGGPSRKWEDLEGATLELRLTKT